MEEEELWNIKADQFDKGWRYGLLTGASVAIITIVIAILLN